MTYGSSRTKVPMKGGYEYDYLTGWRRFLHSDRGRAKGAKRSYNRRLRRVTRGSASAAQWAHNPPLAGSTPAPATTSGG